MQMNKLIVCGTLDIQRLEKVNIPSVMYSNYAASCRTTVLYGYWMRVHIPLCFKVNGGVNVVARSSSQLGIWVYDIFDD